MSLESQTKNLVFEGADLGFRAVAGGVRIWKLPYILYEICAIKNWFQSLKSGSSRFFLFKIFLLNVKNILNRKKRLEPVFNDWKVIFRNIFLDENLGFEDPDLAFGGVGWGRAL